MKFRVIRLRERGRRRDHPFRNTPGHVGDVEIFATIYGEAAYSIAALIGNRAVNENLIPPLYEPVVVSMSALAMMIRGYERIEEPGGHRSVVQEWHCSAPD